MKAIIDVTRLLSRAADRAPTGIDRVELAYAEHFLQRPGTEFVRTSRRVGPAAVSRARIEKLLATYRARWSEVVDPGDELAAIAGRMATTFGVAGTVASEARSAGTRSPRRRSLWSKVRVPNPLPRFGGEEGAVYFHVSHQSSDEPHRFEWLKEQGVPIVFACHDLIPIRFPEYCQPGAREKHLRRIETFSRLADAVFVISNATRDDLLGHLARNGMRQPPVIVAPLGVEPLWTASAEGASTLKAPAPFFLTVGTIEARKNHAFLLALWREMVAEHGDDAPVLLVVGARGWEAEAARGMLDRCLAFDGHVHELGSVSDAALRVLMRDAAGLLSPSFAEGYSYPPIEAMMMGTPLVVSDIRAHREYLGPRTTFVSPTDGPAWKRAILEAARSGRSGEPSAPPVPDLSWKAHFEKVADGMVEHGIVRGVGARAEEG